VQHAGAQLYGSSSSTGGYRPSRAGPYQPFGANKMQRIPQGCCRYSAGQGLVWPCTPHPSRPHKIQQNSQILAPLLNALSRLSAGAAEGECMRNKARTTEREGAHRQCAAFRQQPSSDAAFPCVSCQSCCSKRRARDLTAKAQELRLRSCAITPSASLKTLVAVHLKNTAGSCLSSPSALLPASVPGSLPLA
jgi:hypothetical protein